MKCKAFDLYLRQLNHEGKNSDKWINDKRLTQTEKKIIQGHLWIRNNQNSTVLAELSHLPTSEIDFVNAHFSLLLGIANHNLTHYAESRKYLLQAEEIFSSLDLTYYQFIANFNLFLLSSNQVDLAGMKTRLEKLKSIPSGKNVMLEIRLKRCEFIFADESGEFTHAEILLGHLNKLKPDMTENDIISHLVSEFMFLVKIKALDRARLCLNEMKKHRKFHLNENFNFMKKLLDNLTDNIPIYMSQDLLKEIPVLHHQLQVIMALEASESEKALASWKALQELAPQTYGSPFEYQGTTCLFSLGLDKYRANYKVHANVENIDGTKLSKLISILTSTNASIPKAFLYELLWGELPETKDDLSKLTRLVYKARVSTGINIKTRKGCYFVEAAAKSKVKSA